jgi:hypothetical protein
VGKNDRAGIYIRVTATDFNQKNGIPQEFHLSNTMRYCLAVNSVAGGAPTRRKV